MKTRLLILLLLLCGATLLQAKTVNKIVFKRSISGPVKLKDSAGGWYTVTNGESFTGEYYFIRGYDGNCNGLSVRHKGEYSRPGDNRSDFIRTWYVGESVMPYLNDSYHDCPNAKSSSSGSSSSSRNSSSSSYNSSSSFRNTSSYNSSSSSSYQSSSASQSNTAGDGTLPLVGKWRFASNNYDWYIEVTNDNGQYGLRANQDYLTTVTKIDDYTFDVYAVNHKKENSVQEGDCDDNADPGYRRRGVYRYDEWETTDIVRVTLNGNVPHVQMYKQHLVHYLRGRITYEETVNDDFYFFDLDLVRY